MEPTIGVAQRVAADDADALRTSAVHELLARSTTIDVRGVSRKLAIREAAASAKVPVQYQAEALEAYTDLVTLRLAKVPLGVVLDRILAGTTLAVEPDARGRVMIVDRRGASDVRRLAGDSGVVTGVVTDSATRQGMGGVTVSVQGTVLRAITAPDGTFRFGRVPAGARVVVARRLGYLVATRPVDVPAGDAVVTIRFMLPASATPLSGVVTTATGTQRRLEVGNDITVLNVDSVMKTAPIRNVTDLLDGRVPGLVVTRTSGQPGAPSRIRLRGTTSVMRSNDPIVIVDGIRVDAAPPELLHQVTNGYTSPDRGYATPSPLDQIDPSGIEKIEVLKGPSASALYGSDAANGVIVVTTKRGRSGPARWSVTASKGFSYQPGGYPTGHYAFGRFFNDTTHLCALADPTCIIDTVVTFQALNDRRFSVVKGHGGPASFSGSVSGGGAAVTYALTGSARRETGQLELPAIEVERFTKFHGGMAPPDWMVHPDRYSTAAGTSNLNFNIGQGTARPGSIALTSTLTQSNQQQSSLQAAIGALMATYVDTMQLDAVPLLSNPSERVTARMFSLNNALSANWAPVRWLPLTATAGVSFTYSARAMLQPRNYNPLDTLGQYVAGHQITQQNTLNASTRIPARWANLAMGLNVMRNSMASMDGLTRGLAPGVNSPPVLTSGTQSTTDGSVYGWYVEPQLNVRSRFFVTPGFRLDGGSASGAHGGINGGLLALFPKFNFSWVAVDRQEAPLFGVLSLLRPRLALGVAGRQPGPADKYRTLAPGTVTYGGALQDIVTIDHLGNTQLRPERTRELEGGTDAELWRNRVSLSVTGYYKNTYDDIMPVRVAASVRQGTVLKNIGQVRNTGVEVQLQTKIVERSALGWTVHAALTRQDDHVVRLAPGLEAELNTTLSNTGSGNGLLTGRIVAGYPISGLWARPIVGYADVNGDSIIQSNEIRVGDSLSYLGQQQPTTTATFGTDFVLGGRLRLSTQLQYDAGITQVSRSSTATSPMIVFYGNDRSQPLPQQAAFAALFGGQSAYGTAQTVRTLAWQNLSVGYTMPLTVARLFRVTQLEVAIQGSNLGQFSNYRGKDPHVNYNPAGIYVTDGGQLPQPRTWVVNISVGR